MFKIIKKNSNLLIIAGLLVFLIPFLVSSQILESGEEITILASPENPEANESVSFSIFSSSPNLDGAFITWRKNGISVKTGVGEVRYRTTMGGGGSVSIIEVIVSRNGFESARGSIRIRPAEVNLVWEADSYTPLLYKGKALASHQSEVTVVAMPNLRNAGGGKISTRSLLYEWQLDGKLDKAKSGVGKNVFRFFGVLISRPRTVTLLVKSQDETISARKTIVVNFVEPNLVIYKKNPLTGVRSNLALGIGFVEGGESTFVVEPYFLSGESFDKNLLDYKWIVDGRRLNILNKSNEITFGDDVVGRSSVSVEVSNPFRLLQIASKFFNVVVK